MYIVAEDPVSGTLVKLPGEGRLNPATGQLITTFKNSPQLPFEDAKLHFFGGERAPLATPSHCGAYTTTGVVRAVVAERDEAAVTRLLDVQHHHGPTAAPAPARACRSARR